MTKKMKNDKNFNFLLAMIFPLISLVLSACLGVPSGISPVEDFELKRYLGTWYEIARLDHPFERGLQKVTAEYSLRDDGGLRVVNRGYSVEDNEWKKVEGKGFFVKSRDEGYLKISFFGPFYASYVVFELDKDNYNYAFVTSSEKSYLWLLARSPLVQSELLDRFVQRSKELGFKTENLILVQHGNQVRGNQNQGPVQY